MARDAEAQISIEQDKTYFRVYIKIGTHKLHSEKLNLDTAYSLAYRLQSMNLCLKDFWMEN